MKPKKWTDCYRQGSKEGDEEVKFFIALSRHPKYKWRSTESICKESGLTPQRVDEILKRYLDMNMIISSPTHEDHWAYWERVPELLPKPFKSMCQKDQEERMSKVVN